MCVPVPTPCAASAKGFTTENTEVTENRGQSYTRAFHEGRTTVIQTLAMTGSSALAACYLCGLCGESFLALVRRPLPQPPPAREGGVLYDEAPMTPHAACG